jgi:hypothetical protein
VLSACIFITSAIIPTSLAFLSPHCWPCPASAGRSTATKLALTLLTGRLESEASEPAGDRPRLGGDVDVAGSPVLFSNIARRLRTPVLLLANMTVRFVVSQRQRVREAWNAIEGATHGKASLCGIQMAECAQTETLTPAAVPATRGLGGSSGTPSLKRIVSLTIPLFEKRP